MARITKRGIGPWRKTIVEHAGSTDVYSGSATVSNKDGSLCVTEKGLFSENSTCYLDEPASNSSDSLPNGSLVGKSKSIVVEKQDGSRSEFKSGIMSIQSMEKSGNKVHVKETGLFGTKVTAVLDANDIVKIESEDCNVCKSANPLYKN